MGSIGAFGRNGWIVGPDGIDMTRRRLDSRSVTFTASPQPLTVDLHRTAVIVVDMQNDFCTPGGWLASIGVDTTPLRQPVTALRRALPLLRHEGVPVIWLNWGNRSDRANVPPNVLHVYDPTGEGVGIGDELGSSGSRVLEKGSWSAATIDELKIEPEDITVDKYRMSGFFDTELDSILRNLDVSALLFGGVNADQCVFATLIDAACLGYDCVLLEDCAASSSPAYCMDATLYNVRQCFGFVTTSSELLHAIERDGTPSRSS